ncbi:MAG: hypothetical protein HYU30_10455 [Chloroflexi bacterium]|nr:hypothetical protein [Chloroflexota bacterium]
MEDLLPGLFKAMEDRLGKHGRPITTGLIVLVALGLAAWMIGLITNNIVAPLFRVAKPLLKGKSFTVEGPDITALTLSLLVVGILVVGVFLLLNRKVKEIRFKNEIIGKLASSTYYKTEELEGLIQKAQQELTSTSEGFGAVLKGMLDLMRRDNEMRNAMNARLFLLLDSKLDTESKMSFMEYLEGFVRRQPKP